MVVVRERIIMVRNVMNKNIMSGAKKRKKRKEIKKNPTIYFGILKAVGSLHLCKCKNIFVLQNKGLSG